MILTAHGYEDVRVLDGGLARWFALGKEVVPGKEESDESLDIGTVTCNEPFLIRLDEIVEVLTSEDPNVQIVDSRGAKDFNGKEDKPIEGCASGHIKGAINVDINLFKHSDLKQFKDSESIAQIAADYGIDKSKTQIVHCRTGMSAATAYLALKEAGYTNLRFYDGSWSEFGCEEKAKDFVVT